MAIERDTVWVVVNWHGDMLRSTVARTRTEAIKEMTGPEHGYITRWRYWYRKYGCRCVRARLVPVGGDA